MLHTAVSCCRVTSSRYSMLTEWLTHHWYSPTHYYNLPASARSQLTAAATPMWLSPPWKSVPLWNLCLQQRQPLMVKFMLGVLYVSSREKLFPVKFMLGVTCFFQWKTIPVKFMLGVPYVSSHEKLSPWKLCLVSNMFLPREKLFPVKFMRGVPYVSSRDKLSP